MADRRHVAEKLMELHMDKTRKQSQSRVVDVDDGGSDGGDDEKPPIFDDRMRQSLEIIDECRRLGLDRDMRIPAIAVIGDQSVGKSSVLEHLSGVNLPRGTGIVTRCPLQLSMRNTKMSTWSGTISYKTLGGEDKCVELENPNEVCNAILTAQSEMTKDKGDIGAETIFLQVESQYSPDLTLIDLPGIVRISNFSNPAQSDSSRYQMVRELLLNYITREEVTILVVIPSHHDIETIGALSLAREADPKLQRTIGVISRPDLANPGSEREIVALASNQRIKLQKGYVVVKCRSQDEIDAGKPLKNSLKDEVIFFMSNPRFKKLPPNNCGTWNLASKLSSELFASIRLYLPQMIKAVAKKVAETQQEIESLGGGIPGNTGQKCQLLMQLLIRFTDDFRRIASGNTSHDMRVNHLFAKARERVNVFADSVEKALISPEDTSLWKALYNEVIDQRGAELPMFLSYFPVCERVIKSQFLDHVIEPAFQTLIDVDQEVDDVLHQLADVHFSDYPRLASHIKTETKGLRQTLYQSCHKDVEKIFAMENVIWTQDRTFLDELNRSQYQPHRSPSVTEAYESNDDLDEIQKMFHRLQCKGADDIMTCSQTYIKISARRITDAIPMTILYHFLIKLSESIQTNVLAEAASNQTQMLDLLEEDQAIVDKRRAINKELERWKATKIKLSHL